MFDKLLLAMDDSDHAQRSLEAARSAAKLSGGEVRVLHVKEMTLGRGGPLASQTPVTVEDTDEAHEIVDTAVEALTSAGVRATGTLRTAGHSRIAAAIVDEAESSGAQLIVMGLRGPGIEGLVLGSTTQKVLHLTKLPVLVVR